jgi:hypothetical protein
LILNDGERKDAKKQNPIRFFLAPGNVVSDLNNGVAQIMSLCLGIGLVRANDELAVSSDVVLVQNAVVCVDFR